MAEGLGRYYLKDIAEVESAGLYGSSRQAAQEAIELLRRFYTVDISSHRSRSVDEVDLNRFDLIISLDEVATHTLKNKYQVPDEKLLRWEVPDPIGGTISDYEQALNLIKEKLLEFRKKFFLK